MKYSYSNYVEAFSDSYKKVEIDHEYVNRIAAFVKELITAKSIEKHHQRDNLNEIKRFTTGYLGEAAIEKLLGIKIIDWTIGYSGLYHQPDIPGYSVGIKTVEQGKFPIIFKKNDYPQIICIRSLKEPNLIYVCGLAVPRYIQSTKKARATIFESNVKDIVQTLQVYNANSTLDPSMSLYPSSLEDLKFKNMFKEEPTNPYTGKSMLSSAPTDSGIQYQSTGSSYSICIAQQDVDDVNNNGRTDDPLPVTLYPACTD